LGGGGVLGGEHEADHPAKHADHESVLPPALGHPGQQLGVLLQIVAGWIPRIHLAANGLDAHEFLAILTPGTGGSSLWTPGNPIWFREATLWWGML
jgi:hypothetical protein